MGWNHPEGYIKEFGKNGTISNIARNIQDLSPDQCINAFRDSKISKKKSEFKSYIEYVNERANIGQVIEGKTTDNEIEYIIKLSERPQEEIQPNFKDIIKVDIDNNNYVV